jgi:hypothetical protein
MEAEIEDGLLAIGLDDEETQEAQVEPDKAQEQRVGQTEQQFQHVKSEYRPKVENGEVSG